MSMTDTDQIRSSKIGLRAQMRATLEQMTPEQRHTGSVAACNRLLALEAFKHASTVMLYLPMANEIDVTGIAVRCFREGKTVCVPRVDWKRRDMQAVEVTCLDDRVMELDEHGVRCPTDGRPMVPSMIDLVIAPALAFDQRGMRLGRGGGYYDRFLSRLKPTTTTVGIVFDQQIVDEVPMAAHDIAVDKVVTDRRVTCAKALRAEKD
jgi:5-formyltetrahydrofolate cyclo-ligase